MIRLAINDNGYIPQLEVAGDPLHIAAELAAVACEIYAILSQSDADTADTFKTALQALLKEGGAAWNVNNSRNTGRGGCVIARAMPDSGTENEEDR